MKLQVHSLTAISTFDAFSPNCRGRLPTFGGLQLGTLEQRSNRSQIDSRYFQERSSRAVHLSCLITLTTSLEERAITLSSQSVRRPSLCKCIFSSPSYHKTSRRSSCPFQWRHRNILMRVCYVLLSFTISKVRPSNEPHPARSFHLSQFVERCQSMTKTLTMLVTVHRN